MCGIEIISPMVFISRNKHFFVVISLIEKNRIKYFSEVLNRNKNITALIINSLIITWFYEY